MRCTDCQGCHSRVGWIGLVASVLIGAFTIVVGLLTNSKALIAASLCSGIDVATALTVLLGLKLSGKPIDLEHPYGHGKVEFIAVGGISVLLVVSALVLFFHSARSIYNGEPGPQHLLTLAAALVAAAANEIKFRYARCVGRQLQSPAIMSHAEHARVDAVSSAAVGVGVVCARVGLHFVDPLIAIFEIGHILNASVKMLVKSIRSLMDISLPQDRVGPIREMTGAVEGVEGINYLFARQLGQHIWIELSIFVDPEITVYDGKLIAEKVRTGILENTQNIGNVQVQFMAGAA
ncbi:MAG: cation transporter [Candidatus Glassbacteria bacterium]|nr:cation transporter [Candidatus Glassbacteria bacterium]